MSLRISISFSLEF